MPDTATEHDTMRVEAKMTTSRTRLVLIPIERASSSPNESTLSFQLSSNKRKKPQIMGMMTAFMSPSFTLAKLPMSQKVMVGSLSLASAMSFTSDVPDWKSVDTRMPPRMRPRMASERTMRLSHTAHATATMPPANAKTCTM